jgi:hypothetical protein
MQESFSQILKLCKEQNVDLHLGVKRAGEFGIALDEEHVYPNHASAAFALAANILRKNPETKLADKTIEASPKILQNLGTAALISVINSSVKRITNFKPERSFDCGYAKYIDACNDAESAYASAFRTMVNANVGGTVISDEETPIFFKKHLGQPSALILEEITINGVKYLPGSIARVDLKGGEAGFLPKQASVDSVASVGIIRLSDFMFNEREETQGHSPNSLALMRHNELEQNLTVEDFFHAAKNAINPPSEDNKRLHKMATSNYW